MWFIETTLRFAETATRFIKTTMPFEVCRLESQPFPHELPDFQANQAMSDEEKHSTPSVCLSPNRNLHNEASAGCQMNLLLPARRKRKDTATIVPAHAVGIGSVFKKLHPDIFSFHKRKIHLYVPGSPSARPHTRHLPGGAP